MIRDIDFSTKRSIGKRDDEINITYANMNAAMMMIEKEKNIIILLKRTDYYYYYYIFIIRYGGMYRFCTMLLRYDHVTWAEDA